MNRRSTIACSCFLVAVVAAFAFSATANAVTIQWSTIGNPGNVPDTNGYGAVGYEYRIGTYEITVGQYAEFLNAKANSDPYGLYANSMAADLNIAGIQRNGSSGSYTYSVITNGGSSASRPITYVSWFDAARFANWMHNGQGSGSTETGAYTLVGGQTGGTAPARNAGAKFYIPTENEWYKAAYYSPVLNAGTGGYHLFATQTSTTPGNGIGGSPNQANWNNGVYAVTQNATYSTTQNYLTNVGAFSGSPSYYGTFDQSGNATEWNDLTGAASSTRGVRGGRWDGESIYLSSAYGDEALPSISWNSAGFRLAAAAVPVPEPATYAMALAGLACGGFSMWRRRKRA